MAAISAEQVGAQIQAFWNASCSRSGQLLEQMYFPSAIVFGTFARRSESAQLMLTRRLRKFSDAKSYVSAELGSIDIQIAGDIAVASYPYHFHLIKTNSDGSRVDLDVPYARATQVFQADQKGALRILHEHFSVAEPGKTVLIPSEGSSATQPLPAPATHAGKKPAAAAPPLTISETGSFPESKPILADEVRAAVHNCWDAMRAKSKDRFAAVYFPTAIFFAADARRSEPARLVIVRRTREFFGAASSVKVDLSPIDVQIAGSVGAIASYTFHFHMVRQLANGKCHEKDVPFCRATALFQRDETGALRIFHEHQSSIDVGVSKELPVRESALAK
jgi:ketosteroid isomerase-like protein